MQFSKTNYVQESNGAIILSKQPILLFGISGSCCRFASGSGIFKFVLFCRNEWTVTSLVQVLCEKEHVGVCRKLEIS